MTPFTPRTKPWQYPEVTGPRYWNIDMTVSKYFPITERYKLELKFESYNLTNSFVPEDPNVNVLSSLFGKSTTQARANRPRDAVHAPLLKRFDNNDDNETDYDYALYTIVKHLVILARCFRLGSGRSPACVLDLPSWQNGVIKQTNTALGRPTEVRDPRKIAMTLRFQF